MKTVLLSQRVSCKFETTIIGSPHLQEALFLRVSPRHKRKVTIPTMNPLFMDKVIQSRLGIRTIKTELLHSQGDMIISSFGLDVIFEPIDRLESLPAGSWEKLLVVQPTVEKKDSWNLGFRMNEESEWTKSVGRGEWKDARTLGELVDVVLDREEDMRKNPWQ